MKTRGSQDSLRVHRLFISYAREDKAWALEQARVARRSGQDVFLDTESTRTGEDWPQRLRQALEEVDQIVLGWSVHAAQSEWVRREYARALQIRAAKRESRFLTIDLLDETPLPASLSWIQAERSALANSAPVDRLLYEPNRILPEGTIVPTKLLRAEYGVAPFEGRDELLADLRNWALSGKVVQLRLYVGPGGAGKTRLLIEVCNRLREEGWDARFLDPEATDQALTGTPEVIDALLDSRIKRARR